ncbi:MAG: hypothetical protein PHH14_00895 [Candidatus Margulisbacteria bacterium]|nr:hypothetical protein [Candidatus Margulisiibacteriota bacterium]
MVDKSVKKESGGLSIALTDIILTPAEAPTEEADTPTLDPLFARRTPVLAAVTFEDEIVVVVVVVVVVSVDEPQPIKTPREMTLVTSNRETISFFMKHYLLEQLEQTFLSQRKL